MGTYASNTRHASSPAELRPALERAFGSGLPAVVNVLTDPGVGYPRRSNLA
jgi:acetolactate synthase-1/2/3 large subunit